jgi:hypothetical protein
LKYQNRYHFVPVRLIGVVINRSLQVHVHLTAQHASDGRKELFTLSSAKEEPFSHRRESQILRDRQSQSLLQKEIIKESDNEQSNNISNILPVTSGRESTIVPKPESDTTTLVTTYKPGQFALLKSRAGR